MRVLGEPLETDDDLVPVPVGQLAHDVPRVESSPPAVGRADVTNLRSIPL
jgi:hypothetical protein